MLLMLLVVTAGSVDAQHQESGRWVKLSTNQTDAHVYADTTWLGFSSTTIFEIAEDTREIILVSSAPDHWSVPPLATSVEGLSYGDTLAVSMDFPFYYAIESIPSGATVELDSGLNRQMLGLTPYLYESAYPVTGEFVLNKDGYQQRRTSPGTELWNRQLVALQSEEALYLVSSEASTEAPKASKKWIDYVAASAVLVGGVLAVHYKTRANSLYDQYTDTGDPELRTEIQRLDTQSAVALGTMQVGFTVIVLRLAF